jgi:hypothetical protein
MFGLLANQTGPTSRAKKMDVTKMIASFVEFSIFALHA